MENVKIKDKTKNQINTIYPYRTKGGWAFDDEDLGIVGEALISGIPEIIDSIVGDKNEFICHISKDPMPNPTGVLLKLAGEQDGWYRLEGSTMDGWLCPCMLNYLPGYVDKIYFIIKTE